MLIISRKQQQSFVIFTSDGPITIKLLSVERKNRAMFGIDAPTNVDIQREELMGQKP